MSDDDRGDLLREIRRDEEWLGEIMRRLPEPVGDSLEPLKRRIRSALLADDSREPTDSLAYPPVRWFRRPAALAHGALAAALILLVSVFMHTGVPETNQAGASNVDDFVAMMAQAFWQRDTELQWLQSEVDALEEGVETPWPQWLDPELEELQDLGHEIERVLEECEGSLDV